ncbi:MAG: alpha/beta hydrolase [Burkholderiaceae bacterium]|nr:alpha/beta hydrolase [Burkholderiaceae bacterium]
MIANELPYVERSWRSHDGLRLMARDYAAAAGPARCPIVCIHGLTRNSADFEAVAPWLAAQGRRVLAVDIRGRGKSEYDSDHSHYNPLVYARDVAQLLEELGIARAVFIGTSMGGIITMTLAMRHRHLIAGAVLNDVGPRLSQRGLSRIAGYVGTGVPVDSWHAAAAACKAINAVAFPHHTDADWLQWAHRTFAQNEDGSFRPQYDPGIAIAIKQGKVKTSSLMARWAFRRLARRVPTLLLVGGISDLIEAPEIAAMRADAPQMRVVEVPDVGHAPMLDEPVSQAALSAFLAHVP